MAKREEALSHLQTGKTPSEIAKAMNVSIGTVMPYLYQFVGEGKLCRSEILFSIPAPVRRTIEKAISKYGVKGSMITRALNKSGHKAAKEDVAVYLKLRNEKLTLGDLYDGIRGIETFLHASAKAKLVAEYGENSWWRKGVPVAIRIKCAEALEKDEDTPAEHPYCYTYLLQLADIFKKNWALLKELLPKEFQTDQRQFTSCMGKLNSIRNAVMHPVKNSQISEDDYRFVQHFFRAIEAKATGVFLSQPTLQSMTTASAVQ